MTLSLEKAREIIAALKTYKTENLFAQSDAKHVLLEVKELPENFPEFDKILEEKITFSAYALLAASCSLLENESIEDGIRELENSASLLLNAHDSFTQNSEESNLHTLISSMAFYSAGQYSKAFIAMQKVKSTNNNSIRLIIAFIKRDMKSLIQQIAEVMLQKTPLFDKQEDFDEWVITISVSRAFSYFLEYFYTGNQSFPKQADQILQDTLVITKTRSLASYWLIIRLLRLMLHNLSKASLWQNLTPFFKFDQENFFNVTPENYLNQYIRLMAFSEPPITELWTSQLATLPIALNPYNQGGIINLKTGAGKTRVAELAILQTLSLNPYSKIIYIAPYKSLAFEIEQTLSSCFSHLKCKVSHLYGGSRISNIDKELLHESNITILTPEKARALFRATPQAFEALGLIIIDEGHLIGPTDRYIRNELFIHHLTIFARKLNARVLLLSAILPNTHEMAEWITGDSNKIASSNWKPSAERFGLLRWKGTQVRLEWKGKIESFNPAFIKAQPLGFSRRRNPFPNNKNEAIAATAIRLTSIGPVMIFTGSARSVPTLAQAVLLALGEKPIIHPWPPQEWRVFEAVCNEDLQIDSIELKAARLGIICHSNRLTPQVRMAIERLMRSFSPKIIIATTTLSSGVNVGVSSVIVASSYIDQKPIEKGDFWNICGRAGRAFIDGEGKILYVIDDTRQPWEIKRDIELAEKYFDRNKIDPVKSGIFCLIKKLIKISKDANISFEILLELVANNDFNTLKNNHTTHIERELDLIDDGLLALHEDPNVNPSAEDGLDWIDQAFHQSLAVIQARNEENSSSMENVIDFLKARTKYILTKIPEKYMRKAIISSSLPFEIAKKIHNDLDFFRQITEEYLQSDMSFKYLIDILKKIEGWARENPSSVIKKIPEETQLDIIRNLWLSGIGLSKISNEVPKGISICKDFFGYELPWLINSITQNFDKNTEEKRISALAKIALLVEIGVPSEFAAKVFLAGIYSRVSATEISNFEILFYPLDSSISTKLRDTDLRNALEICVSPETKEWLNIISENFIKEKNYFSNFPSFKFESFPKEIDIHVRNIGQEIFLCSLDGRLKIPVNSTDELPFEKISNDPKFIFKKNGEIWKLEVRDPRYE